MIPAVRQRYNASFTSERYAAFLRELRSTYYWGPDFRIAETPLFLDRDGAQRVKDAAADILRQLATPAFREHTKAAIPAGLAVPRETPFPHFLCVDFALCLDAGGRLLPQLIELQGFPTVACFQAFLGRTYPKHFAIPEDYTTCFGGLDEDGYLEALQRAIVGDCLPENVVLLEIEPDKQKTRVDFACTHAMLGVRPMCVTKIVKRGRKLFYFSGGREVPIDRIYNRVIFDELLRKKPPMRFSFSDDLDVQWAGHPNWYFRVSKHTLPFLAGPWVPPCRFVSELGGDIPADLENYVLKPLYSFAGLGVDIAPTREKITALEKPAEWLLQRKVAYAPLIATPDGAAKAEMRLILAGDGTGWPMLVNELVRLSKGAMLGVDFNRDQTWVGSSDGYHPRGI